LIDGLGARINFILGVHGNFRRQATELIDDMPTALQAIQTLGAMFRSNADNIRHYFLVLGGEKRRRGLGATMMPFARSAARTASFS
jgi:hypothetical protein